MKLQHSRTSVMICPLTLSSPGGGGGGQKVPTLILTFENFLDINFKQYLRNFATFTKTFGEQNSIK